LNAIYVSVQLGMHGCSLWFVDSSPCKQALTLGVSMEKTMANVHLYAIHKCKTVCALREY